MKINTMRERERERERERVKIHEVSVENQYLVDYISAST